MVGARAGAAWRSPAPKASTASTKKPSFTSPRQRACTTGSRRAPAQWPWTASTAGHLRRLAAPGRRRWPSPTRPGRRLEEQLLDAIAVALRTMPTSLAATAGTASAGHRRPAAARTSCAQGLVAAGIPTAAARSARAALSFRPQGVGAWARTKLRRSRLPRAGSRLAPPASRAPRAPSHGHARPPAAGTSQVAAEDARSAAAANC